MFSAPPCLTHRQSTIDSQNLDMLIPKNKFLPQRRIARVPGHALHTTPIGGQKGKQLRGFTTQRMRSKHFTRMCVQRAANHAFLQEFVFRKPRVTHFMESLCPDSRESCILRRFFVQRAANHTFYEKYLSREPRITHFTRNLCPESRESRIL
jgi:hypothetical protein